MDYKQHWETVYQEKKLEEVSWFQKFPVTSMELIQFLHIDRRANIIDIGGGDSLLVDHLLDNGFENISILDISEKAIERAKARLGDKSNKVNWIVSDVRNFKTNLKFDLWHDRAAFHFLTTPEDIEQYIKICDKYVNSKGHLIIGTFAENGPEKCSGLSVYRYSEKEMSERFAQKFHKIKCLLEEHNTPKQKIQQFLFCSFQHL